MYIVYRIYVYNIRPARSFASFRFMTYRPLKESFDYKCTSNN